MNIQEMIERQQAIVDGARAAGRVLSAEESAEFDNLQRQIEEAQGNPPRSARKSRYQRSGASGSYRRAPARQRYHCSVPSGRYGSG